MLQIHLDIGADAPVGTTDAVEQRDEREPCEDLASAHATCLVGVLAVLAWMGLLLYLRTM